MPFFVKAPAKKIMDFPKLTSSLKVDPPTKDDNVLTFFLRYGFFLDMIVRCTVLVYSTTDRILAHSFCIAYQAFRITPEESR